MGDTTRRVSESTGSVGQITNAQTPEAESTWGYQVSTIRIKNIRLQAASSRPRTRWIDGSTWSNVGVTKLKALATAS